MQIRYQANVKEVTFLHLPKIPLSPQKGMIPLSHAKLQNASAPAKSWLVFTLSDENCPEYLSENSQASHIIHDNYIVTKRTIGTSAYTEVQRIWPRISSCSFAVADATGVYSHSVFADEKKCLEFLSAPQKFGSHDPCLDLFYYLSGVSSETSKSTNNIPRPPAVTTDVAFDKKSQKEQCELSIRLLEGGCAKALFNANACLMDVKRWLQQEQNISLVPEDDMSISRYTNIGHFEPSRYAFFCPATRKTFSEAQEFLKLEDLGLCPRSALILRPDYDENAMKAAREADENFLKKVFSSTTHILHALYSFFDYGVDDASRDLQHSAEDIISANLQPPHFLGSMGPAAPSASIIKVHQSDILVPEGFNDCVSHDSSSRANGENFVNVAREEY